ncbi:protein of unknown function DUF169 [Thermodesulfobium narugense DSM 14796]|uniref:Uncharacterized protein n=1 Tax=Thermodesulfobium narugense DSM 14796 TaxID=747365 RepID=M1E5N9_9BACT|nr:DUF169 domain-containing protein [Thermodesulfobium narugense]AEE15202.1 protein of unknown function DUF169 [Thermodesulfobium narugense DSM 14796]
MRNYSEIQDFFMKEFRFMHLPVAVKFIFKDEELQDFKKDVKDYYVPNKPLTFCQAEIGPRMKGITVLQEKESLGCSNAAYVFGWKGFDEAEVKSHLKYVRDMKQAEKFLLSKPRLEEGKLRAIVVSPLAKTHFDPDVVHFYCDNMQAYQLSVGWMAVRDIHPMRPNVTMNSAACAGNVYAYNTKLASTHPACSGSYNAGKTERGETNVVIPGEDIADLFSWFKERVERYGSLSIVKPGDEFPGSDVCKNCPLIVFKKGENAK